MKRRSRTRRVLKWAGTSACVLIVVAWGFSLKWYAGLAWKEWAPVIIDGQVWLWHLYDPDEKYTGWHFVMGSSRLEHTYGLTWPKGWDAWFGWTRSWGVPLWLPLLALVLPTAVLWHCDRRSPKGHCQSCGYDLTGNESGVCPECGEST